MNSYQSLSEDSQANHVQLDYDRLNQGFAPVVFGLKVRAVVITGSLMVGSSLFVTSQVITYWNTPVITKCAQILLPLGSAIVGAGIAYGIGIFDTAYQVHKAFIRVGLNPVIRPIDDIESPTET